MRKAQVKEKDKVEALPPGLDVTQVSGLNVNLAEMERLLSEAVSRFKERRYNAAIQMAEESVVRIEQKTKDYVRANFALIIMSAHNLLEMCEEDSEASQEVRKHLERAVDVFKTKKLEEEPAIMQELSSATQQLYVHQVDGAREHLANQRRALKEVQAMGGDIAAAMTAIRTASETLDEDDWSGYLDLIGKADQLVGRSREQRVEELQVLAQSAASKFLEDVKKAIDVGDFVSANYLVSSAKNTGEARRGGMPPVSEGKQEATIAKVRAFVNRVRPLIIEAEDEGFEASTALEELDSAVEHLNQGDHVSALMIAKNTYDSLKAFRKEMREGETPAEAKPKEKTKGEEAPPEAPASSEEEVEEPVLWCSNCGSINIQVSPKGEPVCLDCGEHLPQKAVTGS